MKNIKSHPYHVEYIKRSVNTGIRIDKICLDRFVPVFSFCMSVSSTYYTVGWKIEVQYTR